MKLKMAEDCLDKPHRTLAPLRGMAVQKITIMKPKGKGSDGLLDALLGDREENPLGGLLGEFAPEIEESEIPEEIAERSPRGRPEKEVIYTDSNDDSEEGDEELDRMLRARRGRA